MAASILGLLEIIFPMAIKLIGMWLDQSKANADTQQKFLDFVQSASQQFTQSASIRASYEAQKERLAAAREKMKFEAMNADNHDTKKG